MVPAERGHHRYCSDSNGVIHAYQAVSAEGVLDSGANLHIFRSELEDSLSDLRDSTIRVGGFTGKSVRASKDGTAFMYVFDPADPTRGKHLTVPVTTMTGGANSNLVSAWDLVKRLGFTCTMAPSGFEGFHNPFVAADQDR